MKTYDPTLQLDLACRGAPDVASEAWRFAMAWRPSRLSPTLSEVITGNVLICLYQGRIFCWPFPRSFGVKFLTFRFCYYHLQRKDLSLGVTVGASVTSMIGRATTCTSWERFQLLSPRWCRWRFARRRGWHPTAKRERRDALSKCAKAGGASARNVSKTLITRHRTDAPKGR